MSERGGICVFVHGRGRGHATRCLPVARALLDRGDPVHIFCGSGARPVFEDAGIEVTPVPSLPPRPGPRGAAVFAQRIAQAWRALGYIRPRAVISDGDHPGLVAAGTRGIPAIAMGHGLVFARCVRPEGLPADAWEREATKARMSSFPARAFVVVNFCPLELRAPNTWLAQPDVDPMLSKALPRSAAARRTVLAYFRERDGRPVLERLRRYLRPEDEILAFGDSSTTRGVTSMSEGRPAFVDALLRADLVVGTAGSNLISECVHLGRPIFALHPRDHDEQRLNVGLLEASGRGRGCPLDELDERGLEAFCRSPPATAPGLRFAPAPSECIPRLVDEICI